MGKVTDLPPLDRPREKALYYGTKSLADHELLAVIIGSGSKDNSALDIAYCMLRDNGGLYSLAQKPFNDLLNYKGMGENKATKLSAAFELAKRYQNRQLESADCIINSEMIYRRVKKSFSYTMFPDQELMYLIILDKRKKIIHEMNLYKGSESAINTSNMQIIQQVIMHSGKYFYVVHNHPSGELTPSEEDIFFTVNLMKDCSKFEIKMVDHLIVSSNGYYSFLSQEKYPD